MKVLVPLVVCGFVLIGFFSVCLSVFLAPSDSYILDNLSRSETTTSTAASTTQIYAIIISETSSTTSELSSDGLDPEEVPEDLPEVVSEYFTF